MQLDGQNLTWCDRHSCYGQCVNPPQQILSDVIHALAALFFHHFWLSLSHIAALPCSPFWLVQRAKAAAVFTWHSHIVSCCSRYRRAALKHAKSHSSSAWFRDTDFGQNFMTYFNHLEQDIFYLRKKPHCLDVTGVWMMNLGGEWEPGNLEFSSCLTAASVALGKP